MAPCTTTHGNDCSRRNDPPFHRGAPQNYAPASVSRPDAGRLPTFLVIGAMKAGTTSLYEYLRRHPDVFMAEEKEVQFFSEHNWWRGVDWYRSNFAGAKHERAVGEASPSYTRFPVSPEARERIANVLPDAKLVYIIRHPVDRLLSQYGHLVDFGLEHRPVDEAVLDERVYLGTSRYAAQIERYLELFDRNQLLVVTTDELRTSRRATMAKVCTFIGVEPDALDDAVDRQFNTSDQHRTEPQALARLRRSTMFRAARRAVPERVRALGWRVATRTPPPRPPVAITPATRATVVERLRPDLERLPRHMGREFDCWGLLDD